MQNTLHVDYIVILKELLTWLLSQTALPEINPSNSTFSQKLPLTNILKNNLLCECSMLFHISLSYYFRQSI